MVFEHIEKLKQDYTDKSVVVDSDRPELRRFQGMQGTVKTVNMSGRALVQFDAHQNTGWYDIDVDYLKVVDAPAELDRTRAAPGQGTPADRQCQGLIRRGHPGRGARTTERNNARPSGQETRARRDNTSGQESRKTSGERNERDVRIRHPGGSSRKKN